MIQALRIVTTFNQTFISCNIFRLLNYDIWIDISLPRVSRELVQVRDLINLRGAEARLY